MITVETLQPDNRVLSTILYTLTEEGYVSGGNEETNETTRHFELKSYLFTALEFFSNRVKMFLSPRICEFHTTNGVR
jgi:hypothetical protein